MSGKAIYENQGKVLLNKTLNNKNVRYNAPIIVSSDKLDDADITIEKHGLLGIKLICKPDQLIKRRGKLGLIQCGDWEYIRQWLYASMNMNIMIGVCCGQLNRFLVEPFIEHNQSDEHYLCIYSERECDVISFYHAGGIDVVDVNDMATMIKVPIVDLELSFDLVKTLLFELDPTKHLVAFEFIKSLYKVYQDQYFTYLEVNPLIIKRNSGSSDFDIHVLDLTSRIDQRAEYLCKNFWGDLEFPPGFGRKTYPEETYIRDLDSKSEASLSLIVVNPMGRIWTIVVGGAASVIFADTICNYGEKDEMANYSEYSGTLSEHETYDYATTILRLMTQHFHPKGKVLIIANVTDVATTFRGIVRALKDHRELIKEHDVSIFVRRAGPNCQEGQDEMLGLGHLLGVPMHVFGPDTYITAIVAMALNRVPVPPSVTLKPTFTADFLLNRLYESDKVRCKRVQPPASLGNAHKERCLPERQDLSFSTFTRSIVWGMQNSAIQSMLDFDFLSSRTLPSVAAIVCPSIDDQRVSFFYGTKQVLIPVYKEMSKCIIIHPETTVVVNFANLQTVFDSTMDLLNCHSQIRCISIIADGIPDNLARKMNRLAKERSVLLIGPATGGVIKPGSFKMGNSGVSIDNIISSRLYSPGSVGYVTKSGDMANELNNIIATYSNGVFEGVAIGRDRYPGSVLIDYVTKYEKDDGVKIIVVLGEARGTDEYAVVTALKSGLVTKPLVAWCIGTWVTYFTATVPFGHAGSSNNSDMEKAVNKNEALRDAGAIVPDSFGDLGLKIKEVYNKLLSEMFIIETPLIPPPVVPLDYSRAMELGIVRRPALFMTSICDERGPEMLYSGVPINNVIIDDLGIGGVVGLLWFRKRLPPYACKFIEMCLILMADQGPSEPGAHNTIVCSRAGKDLISCLTSGLLTIGDMSNGVLDGAAKQFRDAYTSNMSARDFVTRTRNEGRLIVGIGHRVKSINDPDRCVETLKRFVLENFRCTRLLQFALEVEQITTAKHPSLILNVEGMIAVTMVDLLCHSQLFIAEEADDIVNSGGLSALLVFGRSMGLIGHYLDQKRLREDLYRHPWDDISYITPEKKK